LHSNAVLFPIKLTNKQTTNNKRTNELTPTPNTIAIAEQAAYLEELAERLHAARRSIAASR
jgi:hypothetical protein